jgi:hypothetical protein
LGFGLFFLPRASFAKVVTYSKQSNYIRVFG